MSDAGPVSKPVNQTRRAGRPRVCDTAAVVGVLRALVREGVGELIVPDVVRELMARVPCSRRTAYRAIAQACADKVISIPEF